MVEGVVFFLLAFTPGRPEPRGRRVEKLMELVIEFFSRGESFRFAGEFIQHFREFVNRPNISHRHFRIGVVVIIEAKLVIVYVSLERTQRPGFGETSAGFPDQIQPTTDTPNQSKRVNVLIPGPIEIGREQEIVVHQILRWLILAEAGKLFG